MSKPKRTGILLAFSMLVTVAAADAALLVTARQLTETCRADVEHADVCKVVAGWVSFLGDEQLERATRRMRPFVRKFFRRNTCCAPVYGGSSCVEPCYLPCGEITDRCHQCVVAIQDLQGGLAVDGAAASLAAIMATACDGRFDPATTTACKAQIQQAVPAAIARMYAEVPPLTACQSAAFRTCPQ